MANIANINRLKAALGVEAAFNMQFWERPCDPFPPCSVHAPSIQGNVSCGTVRCIMGTAEAVMKSDGVWNPGGASAFYKEEKHIAEWMGISFSALWDLGYGRGLPNFDCATIEMAKKAIDNCAEFDDPMWYDLVQAQHMAGCQNDG